MESQKDQRSQNSHARNGGSGLDHGLNDGMTELEAELLGSDYNAMFDLGAKPIGGAAKS